MDVVKEREESVGGNVIWVYVEEILPNKGQPRRVFDTVSLEELCESIKIHGILQPIAVRRIEISESSVFKYELVAGERRLRAAKMAGIEKIPCVLMEVDDKESAELAIIENLHRKDLNIFETAEAISSLIEIYGVTQEEIASRLSITQSAVANKLRLLKLSEEERGVIVSNGLTERHARCLLRVVDPIERRKVLDDILVGNMNVKESEMYVEVYLGGKNEEKCDDKGCLKRVRGENYANIIQKAIEKLRRSGCETKSTCTETDEFYIYTITVDKK